MLKRTTKFLAVVMAAAMMVGMLPTTAFAAEVSGNDAGVYEGRAVEENTAAESEDTGGETTFGEAGKLNYLYLGKQYITAPDSQKILIGFGDEDTAIVRGSLTVENYRTKEQHIYSSEESMENTVLFELPFNKADAGIYEVKSVELMLGDGSKTSLELADTGMTNVYFGVDEEFLEVDAQGNSLLEEAVVSLSGDGAKTSRSAVNEIGEALANADAANKGVTGRMNTEDSGVVVVLDPGHDATHGGATNKSGMKEDRLNLKIAQYCKEELEQYHGVTVYMTRTGTACPYPGTTSTNCNANRVAAAARVGADYFVSIHLNSSTSISPNGAEVFYPNSNYNASIGADGANLAKNISRQLVALGLSDRGITIRNSGDGTKYPDGSLADYYGVIRRSKEAGITAVIVEHAFLSNSSDAAFLSNESNLQRLGVADATGIANYLGLSKAAPVDRAQVEAYVTRLYELCLGRYPDAAGLTDWVDRICSGRTSGAEAAQGFFFSDEFKNNNYGNEDYVERLYNVMMNRPSDEGGKTDWVYKLNNGVGREGVFKGFADSEEFNNICNSYGIKKGTISVGEGRDRKPGLTTFVARMYTKALGRTYDVDGLNYWCNEILDGRWSIMDAATTGFFESQEFKNKRLTNGEYVKVLYRTFFDREYDQDGYSYWLRKLNYGTSRREVLSGFANSKEFSNLLKTYGL